MTDDYTQAEIVRTLQRLESGQGRMEEKFDKLTAGLVTRDVLDSEMKGLREIVDVQLDGMREDIANINATRAPWWTIVALIVSAIAVALPFLLR